MDRIKETFDIIIALNKYKRGELIDFEFIKIVCSYFDIIKNENLTQNDCKFLKYIANSSGIPHFYNILKQFNQNPDIEVFDLNTLSSIIYESTLHTDKKSMLHQYQKNILNQFENGKLNRYFLSASTSFGKTHLVFEVIKKMEYKNVVLIFPTIALLSENLERIISEDEYSFFRDNYKVHTLSEIVQFGEKNLFIYTPERYLSFIEKNTASIKFDFAFIDEVYKIDNDYIIDEEVKENERDVAYRLAVFYSLSDNADILLAGPYMDFATPNTPKYNPSFDNFLKENQVSLINYNDYEIVNKSYYIIKRSKVFPEDEQLNIDYSSSSKTERLKETVASIMNISQNLIVYCANRGRKGGVEYYADILIQSGLLNNHDYSQYHDIINHISLQFTNKWILVQALKCGIGIHHGLVPKYIQKEIVSLFNQGLIKILISTTTITEGVNTSAKNLIVLHSKKGIKDLKKFDAKNIAGRAGRFGYHYSGRVIDLSSTFLNVINGEEEILKHKNYDKNSPKDEIDLFYSNDEYLSDQDKIRKNKIETEQANRGIPEIILSQYKVVSKLDKIKIFDSISKLNNDDFLLIKKLIQFINYKLDIYYDGFQLVLDILQPIIKNANLKFLVEYKGNNRDYSILTHLVHFYLKEGFNGSINYYLSKGKSIDDAIKETAKFVYNTLKYQTVKYLGVFNLMYKFYVSQKESLKYEDVAGIDKLLLKIEYNALTDEGRIASDYGVPASIVDYYENPQQQQSIKAAFDNYEIRAFEKVERIINKE
jgi:hypothetical protein